MTLYNKQDGVGQRYLWKEIRQLFAALNIMPVADFCAESKPGRRMIDSGRFFEVERQSWLAELRQNFAPTSRLDGHTTWKLS